MKSALLLTATLLTGALFAQQVPRPAPNFTVTLPGGKSLAVESLRPKKTVLLVFISTTCPHCQKLTADLNQIQKDYAAKGVQVVGCAFNTGVTEQAVQDFITQFKPAYPLGYANSPAVLQFIQFSSVRIPYVPHPVLIDHKGVIRGDWTGESAFMTNAATNLRAELDKLLASEK